MTEKTVDTICALSTPPGRSALALIRVSGPEASFLAAGMSGKSIEPRRPALVLLKDLGGNILDEAVVTFFRAPNSYTGEDMLEISAHGNPAIVERILGDLVSRETRLAEPGEFTRRALANGKLSIDQVESLDWVLNSPNIKGVRRGLRSKMEGLSTATSGLRAELKEILVGLQSQLDFSELEVGEIDREVILSKISALQSSLWAWVNDYKANRSLLRSWSVALVGPPNSGKSTLFNALIGKEKAIVFDQPGTTRDYVEHQLEINGRPLLLIDTAGIRENPDPIERLGIQKTLEIMATADLICWISDSEDVFDGLKSRFDRSAWLTVASKADQQKKSSPFAEISVSSHTGEGLDLLKQRILPSDDGSFQETSAPGLTSDRQMELVELAIGELGAAKAEIENGGGLDIACNLVLSASRFLEGLTGGVPNSEVLGQIFTRFCIGK